MRGPRLPHGVASASTRLLPAFALLLGACDDDPSGPSGPVEPPALALEVVAEGLDLPVYVTTPPGEAGRLFVVEQGGLVRVIEDGALLPEPFLDLTALVSDGNEQGLLSLAFHPDYATNGFFYVDYTDVAGDTRVVRYSVSADPNVADPASALEILFVDQPFENHNGGLLLFGPDGMLYVGLGDGGSANDPQENGQDLQTLLGKILRIDVISAEPYAIPADNPFVGEPGRDEIWAWGLRNPWRFSFDRQTGDLYIADVGQREREEVSFEPAESGGGRNYGWDVMEGFDCFEPTSGCETAGLVLPVHDYGHDEGCSITGGYVYRGSAIPNVAGRYFYADYCGTWIRSFVVEGGEATDHRDHESELGPVPSITSFGEDAAGELYVVSHAGRVYRLVPAN